MASRIPRPRRTLRELLTDRLVKLGQLEFEDFCRLEPFTVRRIAADPDWPVALLNAPHVESRLCRALRQSGAGTRLPSAPTGAVSLEAIQAAQERLVRRYAPELLREKAPPLSDCLPWHDWDFAAVARRVPVWQTRFLVAGAGATVTVCRLRRSAGVYVVEPLALMRAYVERKAELEKVKRLTAIDATLEQIPLAAGAVDLAIVGGSGLVTATVLAELLRVARRLLVIDNDPFSVADLPAAGWERAEVDVRCLGRRPGWWLDRPAG